MKKNNIPNSNIIKTDNISLLIFLILLLASIALYISQGGLHYILLVIVSLFGITITSRQCAFDEKGITFLWLLFIRQHIPWKRVTRIELVRKRANRFLIVELDGVPRISNPNSADCIDFYVFKHPLKVMLINLPSDEKGDIYVHSISQYFEIDC